MIMKKLYRSQKDRKIAGVLGGIGEYFNIDPTLVRLGFLVALFLSLGTATLIYIISIFVIPNEWEIR